jgi:DNA ligase 1
MALLWKFLLAAALPVDYDLESLPYPLYASPKIDGLRGGVQRGVVVGRKGLAPRNPAVQELFGGKYHEGLDFEVTVGPSWASDVFGRTQGCCNSAKPEAVEEFRKYGQIHLIDYMPLIEGIDFKTRIARMRLVHGDAKWRKIGVHIIKQTLIKNAAQLKEYETEYLARGYEGVMLRKSTAGPYPQKPGKDNRSTLKEFELVKLKRMERSLACILAVFPLEHNVNTEKTAAGKRSSAKAGMVADAEQFGSVTLKDTKTGAEFSVSLQSATARQWGGWRSKELWAGKTVSYTHQLVGAKDIVPRFPQCKFLELGLGG